MEAIIFNTFKQLIFNATGISLNESKEALLSHRLQIRKSNLNIDSDSEYLKYLKSSKGDEEWPHLIDAITTNVTSFFREPSHFDFLISKLQKHQSHEIKIWCAASSTGEEPYTLSMVCHETLLNKPYTILATDISNRVLKQAITGQYSSESVLKVPDKYKKYFIPISKSKEFYEVSAEIKSNVHFGKMNLSNFPYPMTGPFDFIFVRNVMIYFEEELRYKIISECARLLKHGGYLIVGHSEALTDIHKGLSHVAPSIYIKA